MKLSDIVKAQTSIWFCIPLFPLFLLFLIFSLIKTKYSPFSAEGSELAGKSTRYSSIHLGLSLFAEHLNMLFMSILAVILFLGGHLPPYNYKPFIWIPGICWFALKELFILLLFFRIRGTILRYRNEPFIRIGWKVFLPISFISFCCIFIFIWIKNY